MLLSRGGKGDYHIDYVPAPRITEADKNNDLRCAPNAILFMWFREYQMHIWWGWRPRTL
jgi:hypothetical protein